MSSLQNYLLAIVPSTAMATLALTVPIKLIRLNKSAELLGSGKYRINEVCFLVGFNSPSYFSKCFFEHFGKLPKDYMQMGTASI